MLTASEIVFLKDLVQQLAGLADPSEYTENEVDLAMELLNRLEPIETEQFLEAMETMYPQEEIH